MRLEYLVFCVSAVLCTKYHTLFMDALHEGIECRDIQNKTPAQEEKCDKVSKLLREYSNLRLVHCYNDWIKHEL